MTVLSKPPCPICSSKTAVKHCGGNEKCPWFACFKCKTTAGYIVYDNNNRYFRENR